MKQPAQKLSDRKGAARMADIPPAVLTALNAGTIETKNLVEWLAIRLDRLLTAVLPQVGLKKELDSVLEEFKLFQDLGITQRIKAIAKILHRVLQDKKDKQKIYEKLAAHPSDSVRAWAAYILSCDASIPLKKRLQQSERFAKDSHMGVRECAWDSLRPYFARDLVLSVKLLESWVKSSHYGLRRCAIEGMRPRGVWTFHIDALKKDPARVLPLLEQVKSDPERYVQNAVGNWLNDASKSKPDWVQQVCRRWLKKSPTPQTAYIVKRALRSLKEK